MEEGREGGMVEGWERGNELGRIDMEDWRNGRDG